MPGDVCAAALGRFVPWVGLEGVVTCHLGLQMCHPGPPKDLPLSPSSTEVVARLKLQGLQGLGVQAARLGVLGCSSCPSWGVPWVSAHLFPSLAGRAAHQSRGDRDSPARGGQGDGRVPVQPAPDVHGGDGAQRGPAGLRRLARQVGGQRQRGGLEAAAGPERGQPPAALAQLLLARQQEGERRAGGAGRQDAAVLGAPPSPSMACFP